MLWYKLSKKKLLLIFILLINNCPLFSTYSKTSENDEKYNVGGVLSDYDSEKHFRLTISASKFITVLYY